MSIILTSTGSKYCQVDPQAYALCQAIEAMGASPELTRLSVLASELHARVCKDRERIQALEVALLITTNRMQEWSERGGGPAFKETQRMVRSEMEFWIADARKALGVPR